MGSSELGADYTTGQMSNWRIHKAQRSLLRGLAFPIFYIILVALDYSANGLDFDWVDIFFILLFFGLGSLNLVTFVRTHNRRYARFPMRVEDAARAVEKALGSKFLTYRRKNFFPPTTVRGVSLQARYAIDMNPVSVVLADSQNGTVVCIGPETERTEEQMMMLTIAVSNELSKGPVRQTDRLGEVPFIQGTDLS